jgi:hypothetical protein
MRPPAMMPPPIPCPASIERDLPRLGPRPSTARRGSGAVDVEPAIEAYKVFLDGHEELVRNLNINGLTLGNFKDIAAISDSPIVYSATYRNRRISPATMGVFMVGATPLVSVVAPSFLFDDLTMQRPTGDIPNLPFTKHPFFDSK